METSNQPTSYHYKSHFHSSSLFKSAPECDSHMALHGVWCPPPRAVSTCDYKWLPISSVLFGCHVFGHHQTHDSRNPKAEILPSSTG